MFYCESFRERMKHILFLKNPRSYESETIPKTDSRLLKRKSVSNILSIPGSLVLTKGNRKKKTEKLILRKDIPGKHRHDIHRVFPSQIRSGVKVLTGHETISCFPV